MVERDLMPRDIVNPAVLKAMAAVPRERFMPVYLQEFAYQDRAFPIGHGQTISQPYIVALMTQSLGLERPGRVLEIGTGSGYQAAVLAELGHEVYTIERIPVLGLRASLALENAGYLHVRLQVGDGSRGWPAHAPFDGILVAAAPKSLPKMLLRQLRIGGRLVIPYGPEGKQVLHAISRRGDNQFRDEKITRVAFVPLIRQEDGST
jgi:protein-L-isoaspartate(D-aspartate) O-methyltransferase